MQAGNKKKYKRRKFGFLYHGTLSSSTARVSTGSAPSAWDVSFILFGQRILRPVELSM